MGIFKGFINGIKAYREAHRVIVRLNLWAFFIPPVVAGVAFTIGFYYFATYFEEAMRDDPDYLVNIEWYRRALNWFMVRAYWPFIIWLYTVSYKYVVLALIAPFLSRLSEVVEYRLTGRKTPKYSFSQLLDDIGRALKLAMRNLLWESIIGLILLMVPYIRSVLVFLVAAFYSGFSVMDYTLERKRYDVGESIQFMRSHRGLTFGLGLPFYSILLIPIVGVAIVPVYGIVAATTELIKLEHPDELIEKEVGEAES